MDENFTYVQDFNRFNDSCEKIKERLKTEMVDALDRHVDEDDVKAATMIWNLFVDMQRIINDQNDELITLRREINKIKNTLESK